MVTGRWLIRVASHARHGGGHVSRCGALAMALAEAGAEVTLQLDPDSPEAMARYRTLGLSATEEDVLSTGPWRGSVLDGYELLEREAPRFLSLAPPLAVIDDFLSPPPGTELAINSALHLDGDYIGPTPALLGPRYAMIDPRFSRLPMKDRCRPAGHILVTMGRLDPDNLTERALDAIGRVAPAAEVTIALPSSSPQAAVLAERARVVRDAADMPGLLGGADFVIGAGGVSLMERMAAGVPSLTLPLADNQRLFVDGALRLGATAGSESNDQGDIIAALRATLADGAARTAMAAVGRRVIDGKGPARVAERLVLLAQGDAEKKNAVG
ncbi:MAG: hypothetical protein CMM31_00410 [Rhodospirillaceae bacterium]|nr:hypothetical protein [Rhodospirillaceae bacterium]